MTCGTVTGLLEVVLKSPCAVILTGHQDGMLVFSVSLAERGSVDTDKWVSLVAYMSDKIGHCVIRCV